MTIETSVAGESIIGTGHGEANQQSDNATITAQLNFILVTLNDRDCRPWETPYLAGSAPETGQWNHLAAIEMRKLTSDEQTTKWSCNVCVSLPAATKTFEYRYIIVQLLDSAPPESQDICRVVRRWECLKIPRRKIINKSRNEGCLHTPYSAEFEDRFGDYSGQVDHNAATDSGWLTKQSEIRLRLYANALHMFKSKDQSKIFRIRVTPMDLRYKEVFNYGHLPDPTVDKPLAAGHHSAANADGANENPTEMGDKFDVDGLSKQSFKSPRPRLGNKMKGSWRQMSLYECGGHVQDDDEENPGFVEGLNDNNNSANTFGVEDDDSRSAQPAVPSYTPTTLAVISGNDSTFHDQYKYGRPFRPDDYFVYRTQTVSKENLGFLLDFFYDPTEQNGVVRDAKVNDEAEGKVVERIGFCYIVMSTMTSSYGSQSASITSLRHQPIGKINVDYLVIDPLADQENLSHKLMMDATFARHWTKRQSLNVGHRGMGSSYSKFAASRENTVQSLQTAAEHGADYVEFDVQLTKDKQVVIYHDFHVDIQILRRQPSSLNLSAQAMPCEGDENDRNNMYTMPVKDLKLQQLRLLKLMHSEADTPPSKKDHHSKMDTTSPTTKSSSSTSADASDPRSVTASSSGSDDKSTTSEDCTQSSAITICLGDTDTVVDSTQSQSLNTTTCSGNSRKWSLTPADSEVQNMDQQPFPLLRQVLLSLDEHTGCNIEVKYPMLFTNGTWECDNYWERNLYVDSILTQVLTFGGARRVLFSSFDPDICCLLKLKQNKYPVLFLSMGPTERYMPFLEKRSSTTMLAVKYAYAAKLLGLNFHAEDLLRDPAPFHLAQSLRLVSFVWGDDLDNKNTIKYFKQLGMDGIIYDRINDLNPETGVRKNVFVIEKEQKAALIRSRSSSPTRKRNENSMSN